MNFNNSQNVFTNKDWSWFDDVKTVETDPIQVPNSLYFLWSTITHLQERYDITTVNGQVGIIAWWLVNGWREYPELEIVIKYDDKLFEPADIPAQVDIYPVSRIALATAQLNEQLIGSLDLSRAEDRIKLINWYYAYIVKKTRQLSYSEIKYFSVSADEIVQDTLMPINRAMVICWYVREDLQAAFDLSSKSGRLSYEAWWVGRGFREYPPYKLTDSQYKFLSEDADNIEQDACVPIIRAMIICWQGSGDLQKEYDLSKKEDRQRFVDWWEQLKDKDTPDEEQQVEYDLNTIEGQEGYVYCWEQHKSQDFPDHVKTLGGSFGGRSDSVSHEVHKKYGHVTESGGYKPNGINLVGLVKGELGIGEDVRMAAKAMGKANIEYSLFNFPRKSFSRQTDLSYARLIRDELIYNVNMVNLTGFEHATLFSTYGKKFFDKRFTIGAWPWELPAWPKLCSNVYNLTDEIWASSKYAEQAYSDSPVPVVHMPMTVDFDAVPGYTRRDFSLSQNVYLFLYVFDSLSYMARKNPIAHIKAFWSAFPRQQKDVGLVVKTMNVDFNNDTWNKFHDMVAMDDRISVISETLSKDKVLGLMNNCDAFLSLHRSEGFGRCIAEMMWLGKPVIVTNYSGNTDFTTSETAFLVDGELVPVKPGEYPYGQGQHWCDPDIGLAAEHMRTCYGRGAIVDKIAAAGNIKIKQDYSVEAVSVKYKERLRQVGVLS